MKRILSSLALVVGISAICFASYFATVYTKTIDLNGVPQQMQVENGMQGIQEYLYAVAEGEVAGHTSFAKYGRCTVSNAAMDVVSWNANYVFPTVPISMEIVSASANDLSPSGIGAKRVMIEYLDAQYVKRTEEISMNGTNPVGTTAQNILRVNRMWITQAGTVESAFGNIDLRNKAGTPIYGRIDAGLTQSRQLVYTVPTGETLYITSVRLATGKGNVASNANALNYVIFTTRAKVDPGTGAASTYFYPYNEIGLVNQAMELNLEAPTKIPQKCDLKISCIGDVANSTIVTAAIRGWIETN